MEKIFIDYIQVTIEPVPSCRFKDYKQQVIDQKIADLTESKSKLCDEYFTLFGVYSDEQAKGVPA